MTVEEALIALRVTLRIARQIGVTEDQIGAALNSPDTRPNESPTIEKVDTIESQLQTVWDTPVGQAAIDVAIHTVAKDLMPKEPFVTKVGTESAHFSNGVTILRQRPYLNINFANIRNAHDILQSDTFRGVFQVGRTLSEAQRLFANPEDNQVDGDPGDARSRMLKP